MPVDLGSRRGLVKLWLATLHSSELSLSPQPDRALPGWLPLLRTAAAWHLAYALTAYAGALAVLRGGSDNAVSQSVAAMGTLGLVVMTLVLWWGGVALSTGLWWLHVRRLRQSCDHQAST